VSFAPSAAGPALMSLGISGFWSAASGLVGAAAVAPVVAGSQITYPDVLPGTDLVAEPTAIGVKQSLILHSAGVGNSWVFPLGLNGLGSLASS
jgi:hypothetical protein